MNVRRLLALAIVLASVVLGIDLFWPLQEDFRRFDAAAVGKLETEMWRSYYGRRPVSLFLELAQTLRTQYHFPLLRSYLGAYYAASAAFIFKDGNQRTDYERALPALESYFRTMHNTGSIDFNVTRAAELELDWWIVHRERARHAPDALGRACGRPRPFPMRCHYRHGDLGNEQLHAFIRQLYRDSIDLRQIQ